MRLTGRRQAIMEALIAAGSATVDELSARFAVSRMTIHRDLDELEAGGLLRKVRGGASIRSSARFESDYRYRASLAAAEKDRIARAAARLVEPGQTVILDDGSTAGGVARHLAGRRPVTVITNNLTAIGDLVGADGVTLIALGGSTAASSTGSSGSPARRRCGGCGRTWRSCRPRRSAGPPRGTRTRRWCRRSA